MPAPRRHRVQTAQDRGRAAGARGRVLLARRHGALHQPAEDLRPLRGLVHVRRRRAASILDLQMWYSAVNFGYRNERLNDAVRRQLDRLPQVACQYLHREKIELAAMIAQDAEAQVRHQGPRPLQCRRQPGGRGQPQARAQRQEGQEPDVRLRGRLSRPHARRLGDHLVLPLSPPLRPLRRPRAVHAVPLSLPRPQGHVEGGVRRTTACSSSRACSRASTTASGIRRPARPNTPRSTSSRSRAPAATSFRRRTSSSSSRRCSTSTASCWSSTKSRWASIAPASSGRSSTSASSRTCIVFGKAITNGLNPLSGIWAREELINPTVFPPGSTHSTFNANPMGTGVALEVMNMMGETDYEAHGDGEGRLLPRGPRGPEAPPQDRRRRRRPRPGAAHGDLRAARQLHAVEGDSSTAWSTRRSRATRGRRPQATASCSISAATTRTSITLAPSLHISKSEIDLALRLLDAVITRVTRK